MTTSMAPVRPVVPVLRSPGTGSYGGTDHQVRPDGHTPAGRPLCGARINHSTWTVIAAYQTRNPCHVCAGATA